MLTILRSPPSALRCFNDKSFVRWPPHVNLLYPFLDSQQFPVAAQAAAEALRDIKPFQAREQALQVVDVPAERVHNVRLGSWLYTLCTPTVPAGDAARAVLFRARSQLYPVALPRLAVRR